MNQEEGSKFLGENAQQEDVVSLPSGLQYKVIETGEGDKPGPADVVKVHYEGRLIDGTVFDSSMQRGVPAEFPVNRVIAGWTEALQLMTVGSQWELYIPADLAYGAQGAGGAIGPNATLIFKVELLDIHR
jgi:FKBP-type peptidyl-prolyl cis-trans isomerase FklB